MSLPDRLSRFAPLTGVLFAVIIVVAFATGQESVKSTASGARVILNAQAHRSSTETSDILFAIGFLILVLFAASLRSYLRRTEGNDGLAALLLAGAVIMSVPAILISSIEYALVHHVQNLSPEMARTLNFLSQEMFAPVLAGAFIFGVSAGLAILRGASLPAWLGWVALALGIIALIVPIGWVSFIGFMAWSLVVGILVYVRLARASAASDVAVP